MFTLIVTIAIILMLVGIFYSLYQVPIMIVGLINLNRKEENEDPYFDDFVSIIIPAKNEENVIGRCLDSIIQQSYKNFEVIVVEDGSSDNTFKICKEYENKDDRIKCYHRDVSNGKPSALNYGFSISKGNIIATFDADSVLDKNTIYNALMEMHSKDLDALQGENYPINYKENLITRMAVIDHGLIKISLSGRNNINLFLPLGGTNQYFKREALEKLNGWNEKYLTEDLEISLRMNLKKMKIEYSTNVRSGQETPASPREFWKQRTRWYRGYHQVLFHSEKELKSLKDFDSYLVISAPLISSIWLIALVLLFLGFFTHTVTRMQFEILFYLGIFLLFLNVTILLLMSIKNYKLIAYLPIAYIYWFLSSIISFYSLILEVSGRERQWLKVTKTGKITN
ncbi:MAG: glycosyltransferase [Thermoplasmata archaeon]